MSVGYMKHIEDRPDGSAVAFITFDSPGGRSKVWGPEQFPSGAAAKAALDEAFDRLTQKRS